MKQMSYITRWLYSTSHKDIAILYLGYGMIASMVGTGMSVIIRMGAPLVVVCWCELVWIHIHIQEFLNKELCISNISAFILSNKYINGIAGNKREGEIKSTLSQSDPMEPDYVEVNKLDTLHKEKMSLYSQVDSWWNISSNVIYISIRIYYSWKGWLSYKLICIYKKIVKQAAKVWNTLKIDIQLRRDLSASKKEYFLSANGGSIVVSNIRNNMNIFKNKYNTKWSSQNVNSLRMYATKTSNLNKSLFKVKKRTELTAILINELKAYENDKNIYKNLKGILKNPYFWIAAYNSINKKPDNMTKGTDGLTLDGITFSYFEKLTSDIISGKYQPIPIKRVNIPKSNVKMRSLGISNSRDKIVQAGLASILEAIWEPKFLNTSYGFRPNKSTHTALKDLYLAGSRYKWVIQGNITKCFDSIPHDKLMNFIHEHIKCHLTTALLYKTIRVGIKMDNGSISTSKIGTPQGSVLSPILCNIVLHAFDKYLEILKSNYETGDHRNKNPKYYYLKNRRVKALQRGNNEKARYNLIKMRTVPNGNPNYRRLRYLRYADDFVVLVIGSYADCCKLKDEMKTFLINNCGLELNDSKTKINLLTKYWDFLGVTLRKPKRAGLMVPTKHSTKKGLTTVANTRMNLFVPTEKLKKTLLEAKIVTRNKLGELRPNAQTHLINLSHFEIVKFYNKKINGILNYYTFVTNRYKLGYIIWCLQVSCALTLSRKFKINSLPKTFQKFGRFLTDPDTDIKLNLPKDYKVKHQFNSNNSTNEVF